MVPEHDVPQHDTSPQRLTSGERRARLVRAARAEFARCGYHGANIAHIARGAGCSEPMLYRHFRAKREIFVAALEDALADAERTFDNVAGIDDTPIAIRWREHLPRVLADERVRQAVQLQRLAIAAVDLDGVRDVLLRLRAAQRRRHEALITQGQREGTIAADVDIDASLPWFAYLYATAFRAVTEPPAWNDMTPYIERAIASGERTGD